jgi:hypothetical protein
VEAIEDLDRCYLLEPFPGALEHYIGRVDQFACYIDKLRGEECLE